MSRSREAIVAGVLACCAQSVACTPAVATEPVKPPQLGSFLQNGWGVSATVEDSTAMQDAAASSPVVRSVPPVMRGPVNQLPLVQRPVNSGAAAISMPAVASGASAISNLPPDSKSSEFGSEEVERIVLPSDGQRTPNAAQTTAEVGPRDKRLNHQQDFETLQIERAPSVPRLQPRRSLAKGKNRETFEVEGQARVVVAEPIETDGLPSRDLASASQVLVEAESQDMTDTVCDLVDVDAATSTRLSQDGWKHLSAKTEESTNAAGLSGDESFPELDAVASLFNELQVENEQDGAARNGAGLQARITAASPPKAAQLTLPDLQQPMRGIAPESKVSITEPLGLIESTDAASADPLRRAAELWELAQISLQQARHYAGQGKMVESRVFALEAFRLCVTALDVAEQTHVCTESFQAALDAVRESRDFCKTGGSMREQQVGQTIAEHKTPVLKTISCVGLSGHEAAFHYMNFARCELVKAAKGIPEASEALILLGAAEAENIDEDASYQNAIAVMLQRAAIEICPDDYKPHLALGITLARQGLLEQARLALQRSIEISPTQRGYQLLIELAMQSGDEAVVETLQAQLNEMAPSPGTTGWDVQSVSSDSDDPRVTVPTVERETELKSKTRIGWQTLFPFLR